MELRNSPPRVSPQGRSAPELLEDLCVALRDVAVRDHSMSTDATTESWIREVVSIATELERREVDVSERLDKGVKVWGPGKCRQCLETMLRDRST